MNPQVAPEPPPAPIEEDLDSHGFAAATDSSVVETRGAGGPAEGIAVCLSGGGSRAMLFHAGALLRLAETGVLRKTELVSSVSGGSITSGMLACAWSSAGSPDPATLRAKVIEPLLDLSGKFVDIPAFLRGLVPWSTPGQEFAKELDKHLYRKKTLDDLPATPTFVINATNLGTGVLWRFTRESVGDYQIGTTPPRNLRLSTAVAASSAFPPFFAPLRLRFAKDSKWDNGKLLVAEARKFREGVDLADGGMYDNLGLERAWSGFRTIFVSDGGGAYRLDPDPPDDLVRLSIRVTQTIDHQVRSLRIRQIMSGFNSEPRLREGAYWGIRTRIGDYQVEHLPVRQKVADELAAVGTHMRGFDRAVGERLVNWGYAIADAALRKYAPAFKADREWPFKDQPLG
jgi:NTE family protein